MEGGVAVVSLVGSLDELCIDRALGDGAGSEGASVAAEETAASLSVGEEGIDGIVDRFVEFLEDGVHYLGVDPCGASGGQSIASWGFDTGYDP